MRAIARGRQLLVALLLATAGSAALAQPALAKGKPKPPPAERDDADDSDDDDTGTADRDDEGEDEDDGGDEPADDDRDPDEDDDRRPDQGFQVDEGDIDRTGDDDDDDSDDDEPVESEFEKDLFFVDKVDDRHTIDKTLVQGSFTSSSFFYKESGELLAGTPGTLGVSSASRVTRLFTDLRTQFAARHLGGGNWDVRLDGRLRYAADPANASTSDRGFDVRAQSGALGRNEADLREATLARIGETTTFVLGRQLVPELAATRVDGVRLTVTRSERLSLLGFAGLLPVRGSRSIGFDYPRVEDDAGAPAGRLLPMGGGLGAAYKTARAYGSAGAVVAVPGKGAKPRAFLTSAGYFRGSPQLDVYHYAVVDVVGDAGAALTNLSLGVDFRPKPRVRLAAQVNHVDTESLDIAARTVLSDRDAAGVVRNDIELRRVASNQARVGASIALGQLEQVEVSTAIAVRQRGEVELTDGTDTTTLAAAQSVEVWGQLLHRNIKGARVGLDLTKIAGIGDATFGRSSVLALRAFGSRDFKAGKGELELGLGYASASDDNMGTSCATVSECFGASEVATLSFNSAVYYRLAPSLFGFVMLDVSRATNTLNDGGTMTTDPAVLGVSGYLRLAYRY